MSISLFDYQNLPFAEHLTDEERERMEQYFSGCSLSSPPCFAEYKIALFAVIE